MNANGMAPKSKIDRLSRIKTVSRTTRWIFFAFFIYTVWFCLKPGIINVWSNYRGNHSFAEALALQLHLSGLANLVFPVIVAIWYWNLARLFRFYERGLFFAAETIHTLKVLGVLCAVGGVGYSIINLICKLFFPPQPHPLLPGVTMVVKSYRLGFFSFDFGTGIDFGALMAGVLIVIIAWIMDEGRKIQEEQELTV